jgi:hypothetical protein
MWFEAASRARRAIRQKDVTDAFVLWNSTLLQVPLSFLQHLHQVPLSHDLMSYDSGACALKGAPLDLEGSAEMGD